MTNNMQTKHPRRFENQTGNRPPNRVNSKHRALVVYQSRASVLSAANRSVNLAFGAIGALSIRYDGLTFLVDSASGEVAINNQTVAAGSVLPGACVVALGAAQRRANERRFITFDISHPEIVL
ncbi:hypothetical protein [Hydrogenophaga sp. BPS33]|uniref:hypothetical protein n=1 Tax=Hydrogenophaga sp. BPS33 TaxID=2651974 RepID=UPI00131F7A54|nr:hypothetical protein [Hydrogenophaga sp. BPS33]QHE84898.1 hypothetical protein F9K07_08360 [Hydrogenophaga sp. BPS33]